MSLLQSKRIISVESPLGPDALVFRRMTGTESLGKPFEYKLELLSDDSNIQCADILGQNITVKLEAEYGEYRYFNGFVSQFDYAGTVDRYAVYKATIKPWLWFLTRTTDCRIFQAQSATDIIQSVLRDNGFSDFEMVVSRTCASREYCVQYRETDFAFISRLMEEEGIYYYFRHDIGVHTLVLTDDISSHDSVGSILYYPPDQDRRDEQHISRWQTNTQVKSGRYAATDFDFIKPRKQLESRSASPGSYDHSDDEIYDYPGLYYEKNLGDSLTRIRLEELQATAEQCSGRGNSSKVTTGKTFKLEHFPRDDQNIDYLVTETRLELCSDDYISQNASINSHTLVPKKDVLSCKFNVLKQSVPFRSPSVTPKARVEGTQTAIVVGPAGEEIYTDEYGRVKVQFHWDRLGTSDENSSCWIRVSQNWAGKRWGAIFLPRVGQEVIVDFLEGDPDRPIITGRVYNGDNPTPYGLPANKTQSGIKSQSSKGGDYRNFNELRFEDKKDSEEVYFHAEKDFNRVVENNDSLRVGFDKQSPGNQSVAIHNDRTVTVGHDQMFSVGHDQTITVDHDESITIGHDQTTGIGHDHTVTVDHDELINVKNNRTVRVGNHYWFHVAHDRIETVGNNQRTDIHHNRIERIRKSEDITIDANRTEKVGSSETVSIGQNRSASVGSNEALSVGSNRSATIGSNDKVAVGSNQSVSVGANKTETVASASAETIGAAKALSIGADYQVKVGSEKSESVGLASTEKVGTQKQINAGNRIELESGKEIVFKSGGSSITLKSDGNIVIDGAESIKLKTKKLFAEVEGLKPKFKKYLGTTEADAASQAEEEIGLGDMLSEMGLGDLGLDKMKSKERTE